MCFYARIILQKVTAWWAFESHSSQTYSIKEHTVKARQQTFSGMHCDQTHCNEELPLIIDSSLASRGLCKTCGCLCDLLFAKHNKHTLAAIQETKYSNFLFLQEASMA